MNKTLTVLVCIMVAGVVVGASLPIFDSLTASSESVHNDGAGWVRFTLDRNAGTEYTVTLSEDENGVYVTNGSDVQTYDDSSTADFETILYADSNLSVWCDSAACHVMGVKDGVPQYYEGMDAVTIVRDANGVTVTPEGGDSLSFDVPTWAYIPVSNGNFGFFAYDEERGVQNYPSNMPLAVVGGGNVGVYAYNDIYRYNGLGLRMNTIYDDDGLFYGASWSKPAPVEEPSDPENIVFDPAVIDLDPIDIDLDPLDPGAQIMSVPTPTYTDGDWGYDLMNVDGVQYAMIVSYSGAGGDVITIPAAVGGYNVYQVGKGTGTVFDTTLTATGLVISDGIKTIAQGFMQSCTGFTGSLTLPKGLTSIGSSAFYGCNGFTGSLYIPDSVTIVDYRAFYNCTGFNGVLIIPVSVSSIITGAFQNTKFINVMISSDAVPGSSSTLSNSTVTEVLDLSETVDYSSNHYGLSSSATYYDTIGDCFGFVGTVDYQTPGGGSPTQELISMIPLIMVLGLVLVAVGLFIWNRM